MDHAALVCEFRVRTHQGLSSHGLSEDLDAKDVADDLLGFPVRVGVDQGNVIVGGNDVSQRTEALLDALDDYGIGERISQVLEFLVGSRVGDEQSTHVSNGGSTKNPS